VRGVRIILYKERERERERGMKKSSFVKEVEEIDEELKG